MILTYKTRDPRFSIKEKIADIDDETVRLGLLKALEDAQSRRHYEALRESKGDGGASEIEMKVTSFTNGWRRVIPEWLQTYVEQILNECDPDYEKYLELREKFEGIPIPKKKDFTKVPRVDIMKEFA